MKNSIRSAITLIAFGLVFGAVTSLAQRTGGYREISKDDAEAANAAEFAVTEQGKKQDVTYKLVSVEHAETQTVAGINYRLCLKVSYRKEGEDEDTNESVRVVVFRSLQKTYSLTSWAKEDCAEGEGQN